MTTLNQVKQNLLFYNLWTEVTEFNINSRVLIEGIPKEPLLDSKANTKEIILPIDIKHELTPHDLKSTFDELEDAKGIRPKRIIVGIVNDDGTVVYYFIHDGVYKPKKN